MSVPPPYADADLLGLAEDDSTLAVRPERRDHVGAVLVCADGSRWLPAVLTTLARSERTPHHVVAVDASSTDATGRLLASALEQGVVDEVVTVPHGTPFGTAAAAGVARIPCDPQTWPLDRQWVWLLHDDSAPTPTALEELLHASDDSPSVAVAGPKVRGWHDRRLLVECGLTVSRGGAKVTGLEPHEQDQGQRDGLRDVLAVGSAGMLVRRDAWDAVGGFDPGLAMFRDDVDLCWRVRRAGYRVLVATDAVVHHRQAATNGRREVPGGRSRSVRRADRAAGMHLVAAHAAALALPFVLLRLLLSTLVRALVLLVGKSPRESLDELGALADLLRSPGRLFASRRRVRAAARAPGAVPGRDVRALLAPRTGALRAMGERILGTLLGGSSSETDLLSAEDPDAWAVPEARPSGRWRRRLVHPALLLTALLTLATAVSVRALLGSGQLVGGALLTAPPGAGDLWDAYVAPWHDVALGSTSAAPPWLALVAGLAAVLRGQAPLAVDVLLLAAVPLAGLSAALALRGLVRSPWSRAWAGGTYALLPAVPLAVGTGRIGTAAFAVLLPPLARSAARLLGAGRPPTWRRAWGTGLLLAVVSALVPVVWVLALVCGVVAAIVVRRQRIALVRIAVALAVPLVLLGPWLARVAGDPGLILLEPGLIGPVDRRVDGVDIALLHPGGPGSTPTWLALPLIVAALAAVLRRSRWTVVLPAWGVALAAVAAGIVQSRMLVDVTGVAATVRPWPGPATLVAGAALLTAIVAAAAGSREAFRSWSFGWRQPALVVLAVALLVPAVAALGSWVRGPHGPLRREDPSAVPAFVAVDVTGDQRPRVLVVRAAGDAVAYELLTAPAAYLGDRDVAPDSDPVVDRAVGSLVAGVGGTEVTTLQDWAVGYVLLRGVSRQQRPLVNSLDTQAGLRRLSGGPHTALWRIEGAAPRAEIWPTDKSTAPVPLPVSPGAGIRIDAPVPPAARGGLLVLAQSNAPGWTVRAGGPEGVEQRTGTSPAPTVGRQTARLTADTAVVDVRYDDPARVRWLWIQLAALVVVVVFALPARRRPELDADAAGADEELPVGDGPPDPDLSPAGQRDPAGDPTVPAAPERPRGPGGGS